MSALTSALSDIVQGWKYRSFWQLLAWNDLKQRFRRSWLGVGWVMMAFILFLGAKLAIFSQISKSEFSVFAVYLTVGFAAWRFIIGAVIEGTNTFISAENWVKGEKLPMSVHVYRSVYRNFLLALGTIPPVMMTCWYFMDSYMMAWIALPLVILTYLLTAFWVSLVLGALCARVRDFSHLIVTTMQIMFFLTPIIYEIDVLGPTASKYMAFNPFVYYLDILRIPILEGVMPIQSWIIVGIFTAIGLILAILSFAFSRRRIVFWL